MTCLRCRTWRKQLRCETRWRREAYLILLIITANFRHYWNLARFEPEKFDYFGLELDPNPTRNLTRLPLLVEDGIQSQNSKYRELIPDVRKSGPWSEWYFENSKSIKKMGNVYQRICKWYKVFPNPNSWSYKRHSSYRPHPRRVKWNNNLLSHYATYMLIIWQSLDFPSQTGLGFFVF